MRDLDGVRGEAKKYRDVWNERCGGYSRLRIQICGMRGREGSRFGNQTWGMRREEVGMRYEDSCWRREFPII